MSDNEDQSSRRPARPSTPPFRGPAGPAGGRPPLTPSGAGNRAVPGSSKAGQPFIPPGAARRPATPARGGAPSQPAAPRRPVTPAAPPPNETPAYGSPPPPSVAKTLQSIAEFTIVESAEPDAQSAGAEGQRRDYVAPRVTPGDEESPMSSAAASMFDAPEAADPSAIEDGSQHMPTIARFEGGDASEQVDPDLTADSYATESASPRNAGQRESIADEESGDVSAFADPGIETTAFDADVQSSGWVEDDGGGESAEWSGTTVEGSEPAGWESQHAPPLAGPFGSSSQGDAERMAACLEDVARRIREGGLDIPAPGEAAGQPAILAAVLAAMLRRAE